MSLRWVRIAFFTTRDPKAASRQARQQAKTAKESPACRFFFSWRSWPPGRLRATFDSPAHRRGNGHTDTGRPVGRLIITVDQTKCKHLWHVTVCRDARPQQNFIVSLQQLDCPMKRYR